MKKYSTTIKNYSLVKNSTDIEKVKISSSIDTDKYLRKFYFADIEIYESFFLLLLNRQNITEGYVKISQGGTAGTVVDIKLILRYAIEALASTVIICHNHPSNSSAPSYQDKDITRRLGESLLMMDIKLIDHIILCPDGKYFSFTDEGLI
jgi:DNA repair protein RadC